MLVLGGLAATLFFAGPSAWTVLARQVERATSDGSVSRVAVERVGFRQRPAWLHDDLLVEMLRDISPRLRGEVAITDDQGGRALEEELQSSPFLETATLRRAFPDRFRAELRVRRPVLEVRVGEAEVPHVLVDRAGVCLPPVPDLGLPHTSLPWSPPAAELVGQVHPDPRVRAAAGVACEWRDEIAPQAPGAAELVEIDTTNLRYRRLAHGDPAGLRPGSPLWSEVIVGLESAEGRVVPFAYGHPPETEARRVASATKARILRSVLGEFPGLETVAGGDLRFPNRWRDWVRLEPLPTPVR